MTREPVVAISTTIALSTTSPPTNASGEASIGPCASPIAAAVTGTNDSADTIAVRWPVLGTTIARANSTQICPISAAYAAGLRSGEKYAPAANVQPVTTAY